MKEEIEAAAQFLATLVLSNDIDSLVFNNQLVTLLTKRYQNHWYLNDPEKGSAFRAIIKSSNYLDDLDKTLFEVLNSVSSSLRTSSSLLGILGGGEKWTLWVDPGSVTFRLGDVPSDLSCIREIWGHYQLPNSNISRITTPVKTLPAAATCSNQTNDIPSLDWLQTSPSKRSKAIQIVHPDSKRSSSPVPFMGSIIPPTPSVPQPITSLALDTTNTSSPLTALNLTKGSSPLTNSTGSNGSSSSGNEEPFLRPSSRSSSISSLTGSETSSPASISSSQTSHFSSSASGKDCSRPSSPSKLNNRSRHQASLSISSNSSQQSLTSNPSQISRPSSAAGQSSKIVQEHLNGKVGVLGGGVLLGLPSGKENQSHNEKGDGETNKRRRDHNRNRSRMRSNGSSSSSNGNFTHMLPPQSAGSFFNGGFISPSLTEPIY